MRRHEECPRCGVVCPVIDGRLAPHYDTRNAPVIRWDEDINPSTEISFRPCLPAKEDKS